MAIPIEIFTSAAGAFIAVPEDCALFDAHVLKISRRTRVLRADPQTQAVTGRLSVAALAALEGVTQLPMVSFALGGVVRADLKRLQIEE